MFWHFVLEFGDKFGFPLMTDKGQRMSITNANNYSNIRPSVWSKLQYYTLGEINKRWIVLVAGQEKVAGMHECQNELCVKAYDLYLELWSFQSINDCWSWTWFSDFHPTHGSTQSNSQHEVEWMLPSSSINVWSKAQRWPEASIWSKTFVLLLYI